MKIVNGAPVPVDNGEYCEVDLDEFNICTECGDRLCEGEDGFGTTWGTCDNCIHAGLHDEDA